MEQFKDNFTTPEQSKRLLEFGVPADSADCIIAMYQGIQKRSILSPEMPTYSVFLDRVGRSAALAAIHPNEEYIPCWSVGRLIEISMICQIGEKVPIEMYINKYSLDPSLIENVINRLERLAEIVNDIDFSKLED